MTWRLARDITILLFLLIVLHSFEGCLSFQSNSFRYHRILNSNLSPFQPPSDDSVVSQSKEEIEFVETQILSSIKAKADVDRILQVLTNEEPKISCVLLTADDVPEATSPQNVAFASATTTALVLYLIFRSFEITAVAFIIMYGSALDPLNFDNVINSVARLIGRSTIKSVSDVRPKAKAIIRAMVTNEDQVTSLKRNIETLTKEIQDLSPSQYNVYGGSSSSFSEVSDDEWYSRSRTASFPSSSEYSDHSSRQNVLGSTEANSIASLQAQTDISRIVHIFTGDDVPISSSSSRLSSDTIPEATSTEKIAMTSASTTFFAVYTATKSSEIAAVAFLVFFFSALDPLKFDNILNVVARVVGRFTIKTISDIQPKFKAVIRSIAIDEEYVRSLQSKVIELEKEKEELFLWQRQQSQFKSIGSEYTLLELKSIARDNNLPVSGSKSELIIRLMEANVFDL